jgi:CzcA family heavy metal efflux pump
MLQAIVSWSVHNRVVVVALALLLLAGGFYAARDAKLDVFPDFAPPQVVIQTEAPGLSAPEVEQLVTLPVEYAVNGLPRLDVLRSKSIQGLSVVTVVFQDRTDLYRARQLVNERLAELSGQLPLGVKPPRMAPLTSATGRLLSVGFTGRPLSASDYVTALAGGGPAGLGGLPWAGLGLAGQKYLPVPGAMDLRDLAQWTVRPRLLGVQGVAQVTLHGGEVRQLQIQVSPDKLAARGLSLTEVLDAARQATGVRGAGFLENDQQRLVLRVEGQAVSAADLGETVVTASAGTPVKLKDVARVVEGPEPKFGDAAIDGGPGVILIVSKQFDADTITVTRAVEAEMNKLRPLLEARGVAYHPALFRQANFIESAVGNVTHSLLIGAVLVCVVLFVFLYDLRTAFISLTAIPLSLLGAVLVLWGFGISLNTLTLGGLAIAVGEVVDDAIIDVENIHRRLRENALLPQPRPALAVVLSASLEVRTAVVYATFVVALVFVPVFFLSGLQGRLFAPLGYAYVLAVLASLVVALTVTPALSQLLLAKGTRSGEIPARSASDGPPSQSPPLLLRWLQSGYDRLLRLLDREPALVSGVALATVGLAGWAFLTFGGDYLPKLRESHFVVHAHWAPGTSLPQALARGNRVTEALASVEGVRSVAQQAGRAELGEDTEGVEYSELEVDLHNLKADEVRRAEQQIRARLAEFPDFSFEVLPFLTERIQETLSGTSGAVAVKIYGEDLAAVDQAAQQIRGALTRVPGSQEVREEPQTGSPELVIRPRRADAGRFLLRPGDLLDAVHAAFQGAELAQVYKDNRVIDVVVILEPDARRLPQQVADLWIGLPASDPAAASAGKGRVQLKQVADVYPSNGRFLIAHEKGVRRQVVSCNVQSEGTGSKEARDLTSFVADAEEAVAKLKLPPGVTYEFTGEHQARQVTVVELTRMYLVAGVVIGLLLWLAFGSARRLLLVLANVPFALVGGVVAVYLAGGKLDVGSMIGFVTLIGITMRNSMMMVSHWQHLHDVEGEPWGPELVYRGARERLAPVLMTALVTALGLLPIALGSGEAGREIEGPMAQVILGGLVTSTALNLLVLPVLYRRLGQSAGSTVHEGG